MKARKEHMSTFIDEARDKCAKWEQSDISTVSAIKEDVNKLLKETKAVEGARQKCDSSTEHIKNEVGQTFTNIVEENGSKISQCADIIKEWASKNKQQLDGITLPDTTDAMFAVDSSTLSRIEQMTKIRTGVEDWRKTTMEGKKVEEHEETTREQGVESQQHNLTERWRETSSVLNNLANDLVDKQAKKIDYRTEDLTKSSSYDISTPTCLKVVEALEKEINEWADSSESMRTEMKVSTKKQRDHFETLNNARADRSSSVGNNSRTMFEKLKEERMKSAGQLEVAASKLLKASNDLDKNVKHQKEKSWKEWRDPEKECNQALQNKLNGIKSSTQSLECLSPTSKGSDSGSSVTTKLLDSLISSQTKLQTECLEAINNVQINGAENKHNQIWTDMMKNTADERKQLSEKANLPMITKDKRKHYFDQLTDTIHGLEEDTKSFNEAHSSKLGELSHRIGRGMDSETPVFNNYSAAPEPSDATMAAPSIKKPPSSASCVPSLQSAMQHDVIAPGGYAVFVGDLSHGDESFKICSENESLLQQKQLSRALLHADKEADTGLCTNTLLGSRGGLQGAQSESSSSTKTTHTKTTSGDDFKSTI